MYLTFSLLNRCAIDEVRIWSDANAVGPTHRRASRHATNSPNKSSRVRRLKKGPFDAQRLGHRELIPLMASGGRRMDSTRNTIRRRASIEPYAKLFGEFGLTNIRLSAMENTAYVSPETAHEFLTWRRSLHEFAPLLFQE